MKRLQKYLKTVVLIGAILIVAWWLASFDRYDSYSGSMQILSENGIVTVYDSTFVYEKFDSKFSRDELKALVKMSNIEEIYITVKE